MIKKEELKNLKFEQAMEKLETITTELEKGELDLDSTVSKFEEGMQLSKKCSELLENAERKITILLKDGENNIKEENFEQEED